AGHVDRGRHGVRRAPSARGRRHGPHAPDRRCRPLPGGGRGTGRVTTRLAPLLRMGGTARGSAEPVVLFDADRPAVEAARRDPRAFAPLYRKYVAHVYSFAVDETRDRSVAEDVTEQVFLRALAALPRFREQGEGADSTFRAWLFTIARH